MPPVAAPEEEKTLTTFVERHRKLALGAGFAAALVVGAAIGGLGSRSVAQMAAPSEHKGLSVETLGMVSEESMKAQLGLEDHILLLRAITIDPGGQIAKHSHASVPGLVKVLEGEWVEGRDSGETIYAAGTSEALVEDKDTTHWFYNRGDEPATALVCDIKPAG